MSDTTLSRVPVRAAEDLPLLGLFHKRIEGDDSLMELARLRFREAGMGVEPYAATLEELEGLLRFRPSPHCPVVVHLPRSIDLLNEDRRALVLDFAVRFAGRIQGMVVHDQLELVQRPDDYLQSVRRLASELERIAGGPVLFVEYAAGLEPEQFLQFYHSVRDQARLSICLDVGHLGIWQTRKAFADVHPGLDVCGLKPGHPELPGLIEDVQRAVASALPKVFEFIRRLGRAVKPLHFHLHDGHPLSTFSSFGVSDHLSFFAEIPLGFVHRGKQATQPMFGPQGLARIVAAVLEVAGLDRVSFTLEIHPVDQRLPLGDAAPLFGHWRDKTNAEKMNHWLSVLQQNSRLLRQAIGGNCVRPTKGLESRL
jgi:hypothetical protein